MARLKLVPLQPVYTPEDRAQMLMRAVSLEQIRVAGQLLGLTFREAYAARKRLYKERYGI